MPDRLLRFGTFELDSRSRQLTKQGRRIRVQEQPLRVLEILLEDPGRLVTRQEMASRLWPNGVHVDIELGLTGAIKRLRFALDDTAGNPRFIETVPKAGFRFIAPVDTVVQDGAAAGIAPVASAPAATAVEPLPSASGRPARRGASMIAGAALVVAVAAIVYMVRPQWPAPRITRIARLTNSGRAWIHEPLLTDGTRLYYTELTDTGPRLRQVLIDGSGDAPVMSVPANAIVRAMTPDRTMFGGVFQSPEPSEPQPPVAWLLPIAGGAPRRLGTAVANEFAWSPDGRSIAYVTETGLWIADGDGAHERQVARTDHGAAYPRWSPDGRRIRFTVSEMKDETSLWEVGADGRDPHPVKLSWSGAQSDGPGDWTTDGRYFIFTSHRGDLSNLWALDERSDWWHRQRAEPVQLTNGPLQYFRPLPGSDGTRVYALGIELSGALLRYDAAGKTFEPFLGGRSVDHVSFSHDGRWAAYVAYPEGTLWRSRVDGSDALQLTPAGTHVYQPQWSPDGQRIVFSIRRPGAWSKLYLVSPQGGPITPLFDDPDAQATASWTPDGGAVVYGRDGASAAAQMVLMRYDFARRVSEPLPGTEKLFAPVLSPDGTQLVAQSGDGRAIVLVDLRTHARRVIVPHLADYPAWSADSQYVYFNVLGPTPRGLFRVRVADGREERLTDVPFATRGIFGAWSGLTPDGSILLLADRSRSDVYVLTLADR